MVLYLKLITGTGIKLITLQTNLTNNDINHRNKMQYSLNMLIEYQRNQTHLRFCKTRVEKITDI
jgi:hypothetical protein